MRNFAFMLLLLNLGYFAWNLGLFRELTTERVAISRPKRFDETKGLILISERAGIEVNEEVKTAVEGAIPLGEVSLQEAPLLAEPSLVIDATLLASSEPELFVDGPLATAVIDSLLLDSFDEVGETGMVDEQVAVDRVCLSIGVFDELEVADNLMLELLELGHEASLELVEVNLRSNYWVHMPPFASAGAAAERLAELRAKNIDSYVITQAEGALAQGISLGLFARMEAARRLQASIEAQGYSSDIEEVPRSDNQIWLAVSGLIEEELDDIRGLELIKQQTELKLEEKLCETIAPEL